MGVDRQPQHGKKCEDKGAKDTTKGKLMAQGAQGGGQGTCREASRGGDASALPNKESGGRAF